MPRLRYNCGHVNCTMWHSYGSKTVAADRSLICPSVLERKRAEAREFECIGCGARFQAKGLGASGRQYCTPKCRHATRNGLKPYVATCETCGVQWGVSKSPGSKQFPRYCRVDCWPRRPDAGRKYGHAERARFYGVECDRSITRLGVMERDNWTCGLCFEAIDPTLTYDRRNYQPGYGTIDHIAPMSRGGAHVWANVQAAHGACNGRKSNLAPGVEGFVPVRRTVNRRPCLQCGVSFESLRGRKWCSDECREITRKPAPAPEPRPRCAEPTRRGVCVSPLGHLGDHRGFGPAPAPAPATVRPRCGHPSMDGRPCVKALGHTAKHVYVLEKDRDASRSGRPIVSRIKGGGLTFGTAPQAD